MFTGRAEAGRLLAGRLATRIPADVLRASLVLGLPRGGVPVAAEVAAAFGAELDVLPVRKLGVPTQPELAAGALAEGGEPVWNAALLAALDLTPADLAGTVAAERRELARRVAAYRVGRRPPSIAGRTVVVVDDGLATGASARAAARAVRAAGADRVVLAVPVVAPRPALDLAGEVDEVVWVTAPADFRAVGAWYGDFTQVGDDAVIDLLAAARLPA